MGTYEDDESFNKYVLQVKTGYEAIEQGVASIKKGISGLRVSLPHYPETKTSTDEAESAVKVFSKAVKSLHKELIGMSGEIRAPIDERMRIEYEEQERLERSGKRFSRSIYRSYRRSVQSPIRKAKKPNKWDIAMGELKSKVLASSFAINDWSRSFPNKFTDIALDYSRQSLALMETMDYRNQSLVNGLKTIISVIEALMKLNEVADNNRNIVTILDTYKESNVTNKSIYRKYSL